MLDSGAYSFINARNNIDAKRHDLDDYIERYIAYIKKYNIKLFFEFDIDKIIGYEEVKKIRKKLEREIGIQPIPVWHRSRAKDEFLRLCNEYPYVAIGGLAIKDILPSEYRYLTWFIDEAHKRGTKIHGLGFTKLKIMDKYHFDSVDSSSWTIGNRFGKIFKFNGKDFDVYDKPAGKRVKNQETAINNFIEWLKFANYAERNL